MEDGRIERAELKIVSRFEHCPLNTAAVFEGAMRTVLVDDLKGVVRAGDESVTPGNVGLAQDQVLVGRAADRGRLAHHGKAMLSVEVGVFQRRLAVWWAHRTHLIMFCPQDGKHRSASIHSWLLDSHWLFRTSSTVRMST